MPTVILNAGALRLTVRVDPQPAAPTGLTASAISSSRIDLAWTDNSANEASFLVERSPDGATGWTQIALTAANASGYSDTGLAAATAYYYRVKARNAAGDSAYAPTANATTAAVVTPPNAPSNLSATAQSASRIDLAWTDNSANEASFLVERSPDGATGWTQIALTAANASGYSDTGLAAATAYYYRVKARNAAGDSAYAPTANATTGAAAALAAPTNLRLVANSGRSATLGWDDNTGGTARTQVSLAEAGGQWYDDYYGNAAAGVTSRYLGDLVENSAYNLRVRAIDGAGGIGAWSTVLSTYTSPVLPSNVTVAGTAPRQLVLTWLDSSLYETGYEARWSVSGQNTWASVTLPANTRNTVITGLAPGASYDIQVRSLGPNSNPSSWTPVVTATTPAETMPAAPSNVTLAAITYNRLDAHWTRNSTNENSFEVQYCGDAAGAPDGVWLAAGSTWPEAPAHAIVGLLSTTPYWARVRAVNNAGASAWVVAAAAGTTLAPNNSPTGREPRLLWSAAQQDIWERMKADYDANPSGTTLAIKLYGRLKYLADLAGTPNQLYGGNGPITALMYQITGSSIYSDKAIASLVATANFVEPYSDNGREFFAEMVMMFDWLYPAMTPTDRKFIISRFKILAQAEIDNYAGRDSDQTTSAAFGAPALMAHSACVIDDPTCGDYLNHALIGGLDATAADQTTARNSVNTYLTRLSVGGEWCESSEYNIGTIKLLGIVYQGLKTATAPIDHLPEVAAELENLAKVMIVQLTPALNQAIQWGDNQDARTPDWSNRVSTLGMYAGLAKGTPGGAYALKLYHERMAATGYDGGYIFARSLYAIDPYATETDWRSTFLSHYAAGQGTLYAHDGWGANDSLFFAQYERRSPFVDHSLHYWGGFQLWRKGEWAITNPIGYGSSNEIGEWFSTNAMGVGGLTWFAGYRQIVAQETVDGSHAYIAGDTHGKYYGLTEPQFCNEAARSLVYLPSTTKAMDTIVVFDRVDAVAPLSLSSVNQINSLYGPRDAARILNAPFGADGLKQWTIQAPVQPSIAGDTLTWDTAGGQHVRVKALLPAAITAATYDTSTFLTLGDVDPSERKWQARIKPATDQQWDTFLTVVQVHDGAAPAVPDLIQSSAGQTYQGARIARSGDDDHVLMFGARANAGNRLITTGTTFGWTQGTASATMLLFDLDPAKTWTYSLDGAGAVGLTISSGGVATLTVPGAAAHTLALTGS